MGWLVTKEFPAYAMWPCREMFSLAPGTMGLFRQSQQGDSEGRGGEAERSPGLRVRIQAVCSCPEGQLLAGAWPWLTMLPFHLPTHSTPPEPP